MNDENKTKDQLIDELVELRQKLSELEESVIEEKRTGEELLKINVRSELLLNQSPAVTYSCKPGGDYAATFISEGVKAQLGYEPKEFTICV